MKRLVVLLLVLSVASLAQASFFLTIDGQDVTEATVVVGQTVTVGINSTDATLPPEPTGSTQYGLYNAMVVTAVFPDWSGHNAVFTNLVTQPAAGPSAGGWTSGVPYENIGSAGWYTQTPTPTAGLWFTFTYTGTVAGENNIHLFDGNWSNVYDTVRIHDVVPEPTTMTLLGLGVVALFRKK